MSNEQSLQAQLKDAIARGDKQAVAALMRQGGVGGILQTLRAVQEVTAQQASSATGSASIEVPAAVGNALRQGDLIEAIKRLRAANPGLSLKAAKEQVEGMAGRIPKSRAPGGSTFAHLRERTPTVVMGEKPGTMRWVMVVLGLLALAAWLGFGGA